MASKALSVPVGHFWQICEFVRLVLLTLHKLHDCLGVRRMTIILTVTGPFDFWSSETLCMWHSWRDLSFWDYTSRFIPINTNNVFQMPRSKVLGVMQLNDTYLWFYSLHKVMCDSRHHLKSLVVSVQLNKSRRWCYSLHKRLCDCIFLSLCMCLLTRHPYLVFPCLSVTGASFCTLCNAGSYSGLTGFAVRRPWWALLYKMFELFYWASWSWFLGVLSCSLTQQFTSFHAQPFRELINATLWLVVFLYFWCAYGRHYSFA